VTTEDDVILTLDKTGALFEQLARALKREILEGRLAAGSMLPATRTLATTLGVSRNTVLAAYELLLAEQLAVPQAGAGTRITNATATPPGSRMPRRRIAAQSRYSARGRALGPNNLAGGNQNLRYDLQYGSPLVRPQVFAAWRRKQVAATIRVGPRYPPSQGALPLRRAIADYLLRRRGITCSPDDVVVVNGTQQALTIVARVVVDEGQSVVMEDPHYQYAQQTLLAHGARLIDVPVDKSGLVTRELPSLAPRLIYVTPAHQFPSGALMSLERRIALLNYAAKQNCWIFEDDYDGEFHYDGRPLAALRSLDLRERVIYAGTFSKTLFPGLRLGYIVCPPALRDDIFIAKSLDDLGCPSIEQLALAGFLESRQYEKHLRKVLMELRRRREALLTGLARHLGEHIEVAASHGGMHVVGSFRRFSYADLNRLIEYSAQKGLGIYPIHPFYKSPPSRPALMLGFAAISPEELANATALLARCVSDVGK
jgi:GntR family transcriptional regulator / MocR family aminotransferase